MSNETPAVFHNGSNCECHSVYTGKCRGAAHSICNAKFDVPNQIPVVFHNASNYNYHSVINELANKFEKNFGKNSEKYKIFPALIEKDVTKIDKDGDEIDVTTLKNKISW